MLPAATAEGPGDTNDDTLLAVASQRIDQCCKLAASLYAESVKATTNITNSNDDDASHCRSTDMPHAVGGAASPEPAAVDTGQADMLLMPRQRVRISGVERLLPRFVPCGDLVKALHEVEACRTDADELRAQLQAADETVAR